MHNMDYASSDIYYDESDPVPLPAHSTKSARKPRNLEDRVREYTGYMKDEDQDGPVYYSTERSSDSCSPFLLSTNRRPRQQETVGRRKEEGSRRNQDRRGDVSPLYIQDGENVPLAEKMYFTSVLQDRIRETTIDSDGVNQLTLQHARPPDLLSQNLTMKSHQSCSEDSMYARPIPVSPSKDTVVMPGFPVQTLDTTALPAIPYSPSRDKSLLRGRYSCTWKLVSVCLTVITLLLSSVIIYFGAVKYAEEVPPPLPNSVIDSSGLQDSSCIPLIDSHLDPSLEKGLVASHVQRAGQTPLVNIFQDQWIKFNLEPGASWSGNIQILSQAFNFINVSLLSGGRDVAVYGKFDGPPSITVHDFAYFLNSGTHKDQGMFSASEYMKTGRWYITVYNDEQTSQVFGLLISQHKDRVDDCGGDCNGRGSCVEGKCECYIGWMGPQCTNSMCPVLCSSHGDYGGGFCHCHQGWKGPECNLRIDECLVSDCSGHGDCDDGECVCYQGWTGDSCQTKTCLDPECSEHGVCIEGECRCYPGWGGSTCSQKSESDFSCIPNCSAHGKPDSTGVGCRCDPGWSGPSCNQSVCRQDCGDHGQCIDTGCTCHSGWTGSTCRERTCSPACQEHGTCVNGTCVCDVGWNGRMCGLEGCQDNCHGHGDCIKVNGEYSCSCRAGWTGEHCSLETETQCEDGIDNDNDGLIDCGDSNCCTHPSCTENIMCVYFADPVQVVAGRPAPKATDSFFQRVKFLIQGEKTVQSYAKPIFYKEERASVLRGRVVTLTGEGITGVRVSVDRSTGASNYGFTLTRPGGWFDMLVNGGGAVTLQFQRSPFKPLTHTSYVPWNEIHVIDPIIMSSNPTTQVDNVAWQGEVEEDMSRVTRFSSPCASHDPSLLRPRVVTADFSDGPPSLPRSISPRSGTVVHSVKIPDTGVYLVHHSSPHSTLTVFLTPAAGGQLVFNSTTSSSSLPSSLVKIHTKITIAGVVSRKVFEPEDSLVYTFLWNKRNVYNEAVHGYTNARVSVGYQYNDCKSVIWNSAVVRIFGHRVESTDIGGWNFNIHHSLYQGIVYRGDGSQMDTNKLVPVNILGTGRPRDFGCETKQCSKNILNIVSMTTGPDGSLYIGDYNMIRRVYPDGNVETIIKLNQTQGSFLYDIHLSPSDENIYITNSGQYEVLRISKVEGYAVTGHRIQRIAGTGEKCTPGDPGLCGDGGPALEARLTFPKGLAVSLDKTVFLTDGRLVRRINEDGIINTLVGNQRPSPLSPVGCGINYPASSTDLHWPSKLVLSPVDGSLHILDENQVYRLSSDLRLEVKVGLNMRCRKKAEDEEDDPRPEALDLELGQVTDLSLAEDGSLIVAEARGSHGFNLYRIGTSGSVQRIISDGSCNSCISDDSSCGDSCASEFNVSDIAAVEVTPGGHIVLADNVKLHLVSLQSAGGQSDSKFTKIKDIDAGEEHLFNRHGQHVSTVDFETGELRFMFEYSANSGYGKLNTITDNLANKLEMRRDYNNQVQSIENSFGEKFEIAINEEGYLTSIKSNKYLEISNQYNQDGNLVKSWSADGDIFIYKYNDQGRLDTALGPTGETLQIRPDNKCWRRSEVCYQVLKNGQPIQPPSKGFVQRRSIDAFQDEESSKDGEPISEEVRDQQYKHSTHSQQCDSTVDRHGRVLERTCGTAKVEFTYTTDGNRLSTRSKCSGTIQYTYQNNPLPSEILLSPGRKYTYMYDPYGGLHQLVLPRGGRHVFKMEHSPGRVKISHQLPGPAVEFAMSFDIQGNLVQNMYPGGGPSTIYRYTDRGNLAEIVSGDRITSLQYTSDGRLTEVDHEREVRVRTKIRRDESGSVAEQRINFDAKSAMADAKFVYSYASAGEDGRRPVVEVTGRIGGQGLPRVQVKEEDSPGGSSPLELGNFYSSDEQVNGTTLMDGNAIYRRTDTSVSLSINQREVFSAEYKYNLCNKIHRNQMILKRKSGFFKQTKQYAYDAVGQLAEVQENTHRWKFEYDANGNLRKLMFGKAEHRFEHDAWDQLVRYNNEAKLEYDSRGRMVRNQKDLRFRYGSNNLLVEAWNSQQLRVHYFYDHLDRLVGRRDDKGRITQFYYADPDRPSRVTHVYRPREDTLTSLVYDAQDYLIFTRVQQTDFYIITDTAGAPFLFFSTTGDLIKEVNRSPYGQVTYDSEPTMQVPIGPGGSITDPDTGLIHFQRDGGAGSIAYDPFLGVFLVPDWHGVMNNVYLPEMFMMYRRNGNDPVNKPSRSMFGNPGFSEDKHHSPSLDSGLLPNLPRLERFGSSNPISVSWQSAADDASSSSLLAPPDISHRYFPSRVDAFLGKYIVLYRDEGEKGNLVRVVSSPQANQIYSSVLAQVFNGSAYVSLESRSRGRPVFHFTKESVRQSAEDILVLRRLGSAVNLTVHDATQNENVKVVDARLHLGNHILNIRYGTDVHREESRLIRHALRTLAPQVWERELGDARWSTRERNQIQVTGALSGWSLEHVRSPQQYPELVWDVSNIRVVKHRKHRRN